MAVESLDSPIVVAVAGDDNYLMPLCVAARSVLTTQPPEAVVRLYILLVDVSAERAELVYASLRQDITPSHSVTIIPVTNDIFEQVEPSSQSHLPRAALTRLLIPTLIPEQRVLYLDCDTVCLGSLSRLFTFPFADHIAGVQDPYTLSMGNGVRLDLCGASADSPYVNSGVLLINAPRWLEDNVLGKAIRYLEQCGDDHLLDQEAINAVLHNSIHLLDPIWNVMHYWEDSAARAAAPLIFDDARIRHFEGPYKPWSVPRKFSRDERVFELLQGTHWEQWKPFWNW